MTEPLSHHPDHEGAFLRVLEEEARAAMTESWVDLLRWINSTGYGESHKPTREEVLPKAEAFVAAGIMPPWPDRSED